MVGFHHLLPGGLRLDLSSPAFVLDRQGDVWRLDEDGRRERWLHWENGFLKNDEGNLITSPELRAPEGRLELRFGAEIVRNGKSLLKLSAERDGMSWPARYRVSLLAEKGEWVASIDYKGWHGLDGWRSDEIVVCTSDFGVIPVAPRIGVRLRPSGLAQLKARLSAGRAR
jgi:hypothetical protein